MKFLSFSMTVLVALFLVAPTASAQDESWVDRIKFKGDTRIRHERIDEDGEEDRARMRFRARFGLSTQVSDDIKFVFQLATGGDSPVSTNQAFDDGFSTKEHGQSEFSWTYVDLEADAVIGTFSDSDFGGGGTDSDGHLIKAKYGVSSKIFVGGTLFLNTVDRFQGTEHDYNRLQLDVEFKFD